MKQIEKLLHFSLKTAGNFSDSKPRLPGQRKLGENPTPPGSENMRISGGRPGGWSGLELTDTLSLVLKSRKNHCYRLKQSDYMKDHCTTSKLFCFPVIIGDFDDLREPGSSSEL